MATARVGRWDGAAPAPFPMNRRRWRAVHRDCPHVERVRIVDDRAPGTWKTVQGSFGCRLSSGAGRCEYRTCPRRLR
jgi:hypothetical protein